MGLQLRFPRPVVPSRGLRRLRLARRGFHGSREAVLRVEQHLRQREEGEAAWECGARRDGGESGTCEYLPLALGAVFYFFQSQKKKLWVLRLTVSAWQVYYTSLAFSGYESDSQIHMEQARLATEKLLAE